MKHISIFWLAVISLGFIACDKKGEVTEDKEKSPKPVLKAEDQANDRKSRRDRLKRDKKIYLARLKGSAKVYSEEQSVPVVEKNMATFQIRYDGYVKEMYIPALAELGVKPNPFPESIPKAERKTIGVNFYYDGGYQIPRERKAGLPEIAQVNWSNVSSSQKKATEGEVINGNRDGLKLGDGQLAQNLKLDWQAKSLANRRNSPRSDATGDYVMMSANLEGHALSSDKPKLPAFTLSGLPESGFHQYDLVIYMEYVLDENQQDGAQQPICRVDLWQTPDQKKLLASDLVSAVKVSGNPYKGQIRSYTRQDRDNRKLHCANTGKPGQYIYFKSLTSPSIHFQMTAPVFGHVREYRLAGFQVIER